MTFNNKSILTNVTTSKLNGHVFNKSYSMKTAKLCCYNHYQSNNKMSSGII